MGSTSLVRQLGTKYLIISTISGDTREHRQLIQTIAVYVHDLTDVNGQPLFAGIRYMSRLNISWECWVVFHDRFRHNPTSTEPIDLTDPELHQALAAINVRVLCPDGLRITRPSNLPNPGNT